MTPKEKAGELYFKYHNLWINGNSIMARECALIAVDEFIIEKNKWENGSFYTSKYWDYVKQEIELL